MAKTIKTLTPIDYFIYEGHWYGRFSSGKALVVRLYRKQDIYTALFKAVRVVEEGRFRPNPAYPGLEVERENEGVLGTVALAFNYTPENVALINRLLRPLGCRLRRTSG